MKYTKLVAAWLVVFVLSSCSSFTSVRDSIFPSDHERNNVDKTDPVFNISEDLVLSLIQIDDIHPHNTVVEVRARGVDRFSDQAYKALQDAGYAVRFLSKVPSDHVFNISVSERGDDVFIHSLAIGDSVASRAYKVDDLGVTPIGSVRLSHAADSGLTNTSENLTVRSSRDIVRLLPAADTSDFGGNMFDSMESSFESIYVDYEVYDTAIIYFDNDSLRLGSAGKKKLEALVDGIDRERDIVSLIGCSLGPTAIENGNEVLARGRSGRVKEELVYSGIPGELVLEEGCWAPSSMEEALPSRAVVVSLKRQSS